MVTRIAAAGLAAALSACGGLDTPDLSRGAVSGLVAGASPGGYAYVYGSPQLEASLAPDGTFEIAGVPVGTVSLVLFDGYDRAEMVVVEVRGATRTRVDRTAAAMPLAGGIVAAANPAGGTIGTGASYSVDGTVLAGVVAAPGALWVQLWPLPAGPYVARAALTGFVGVATPVTVVAGASVTTETNLDVDLDAPEPGCATNACHAPLVCNPADGWCYQCLGDADCGVAGETCVQHLCVAAPGTRQICESCGAASDCGGGLCIADPSGTVCSSACAQDYDCPSGFACSSNACVAPSGCAALTATFGAPCLENGACDDALKGGVCAGAVPPTAAGQCTAPCSTPADCVSAVGLPYCTAGYCAPAP